MSGRAYDHLLRPGRIGTMELRNRIVMSPMETMYGTPEGLPSDRTVAHFATRAAGGVGLVTVGATGIDPMHPETPGGLHLGTDDAVAAHRRLVDAVHEHGAKIQPQIVHAGPDGLGPEMHGVDSLGPSVIPSYLTGRPSTEVTQEQIAAIMDLYRAAVTRAREAGYDGIELHAAHGYMFLGSFLAPQRNRRGDRYRGSSVEGRIRVVLEALAAIRSEVGPDFPITLRISGYERVAGGRPSYETALVAPLLVEAGVDAFHVSGGVIDRLVTQMVNGTAYGDGLNVAAAAAVKEVVDVPVIAVGRLHDPALAEQVLADGRADFVAMGRPLLADPDLPRKLASGDAGAALHLLRELHRLAGGAARDRLRGQPADRTRARAAAAAGRPAATRRRGRRRARRSRVRATGRGAGSPGDAAGGERPAGRSLHAGGPGAPRQRAVPRLAARRGRRRRHRRPAADLCDRRLCRRARARTPSWSRPARDRRTLGPTWPRCWTPWTPAARSAWSAARCRASRSPDTWPRSATWCRCSSRARSWPPRSVPSGAPRSWTSWTGSASPSTSVRRSRATPTPACSSRPRADATRELRADTVVVTGWFEPDLRLHDAIAARLPDIDVYAVGDCRGYGLVRQATEDAARAAYEWGQTSDRSRA